jgi:pimeloyl-ACP methyl ester carboxylesterase
LFPVAQQQLETVIGNVEYCDVGAGRPILYFHGTGVGNDAVILLERSLLDSGYRLIVPNRPGYFGTTLGRRGSADFCGDLAAHLLDHLSVDRAAVIGTSGGGMPAASFARRYQSRTAALVLQSAQSHQWDDGIWLPKGLGRLLFLFRYRVFAPLLRWQNRRHWKASYGRPKSCVKKMSGKRFPELLDNAAMLEELRSTAKMGLECASRPAGVENDWAIMVGANSISPDSITAPTLIIHDHLDPVVPFVHAEWSHECIAGSQLLDIHAGGHLIWYGKEAGAMHKARIAFIEESFTKRAPTDSA